MSLRKGAEKDLIQKCIVEGQQRACALWREMKARKDNSQRRSMQKKGFVFIGRASIDSSNLLISDPAYVLHKRAMEKNFGRDWQDFVRRTTGNPNKKYGRQLMHNRGHAGLGVLLHADDGGADVYVKPSGSGTIKEARILF